MVAGYTFCFIKYAIRPIPRILLARRSICWILREKRFVETRYRGYFSCSGRRNVAEGGDSESESRCDFVSSHALFLSLTLPHELYPGTIDTMEEYIREIDIR